MSNTSTLANNALPTLLPTSMSGAPTKKSPIFDQFQNVAGVQPSLTFAPFAQPNTQTQQPTIDQPAPSPIHNGHRHVLDLPDFSDRAEEWSMFFADYTQSTEMYGYDNI